jgi:hypothetical protein
LTRYWDIFDSINFACVDGRAHGGWGGLDDDASGKWGVGRRRNAIVGWNGDAAMAWTWGRRRDRTARTLPAVDGWIGLVV